eukprot:5598565-Alexandrium_andersonii.AAC.1
MSASKRTATPPKLVGSAELNSNIPALPALADTPGAQSSNGGAPAVAGGSADSELDATIARVQQETVLGPGLLWGRPPDSRALLRRPLRQRSAVAASSLKQLRCGVLRISAKGHAWNSRTKTASAPCNCEKDSDTTVLSSEVARC